MQKISVDTLCDNSTKHGEAEVPAESLPPITVGRDKPRLLDLCAECRLELAEPLLTLLDKQGRAEDTGRRKNKKPRKEPDTTSTDDLRQAFEQVADSLPGVHQCSDCGRTFDTARGLNTHRAMTDHDEPNLLDSGKDATASDPAPAHAGTGEVTYPCPTCGKEFARPQGLGAHRARKHGYRTGDDS